ncbi:hypothetical protein [Absidia glauca]|uniref:Uncharacterized protein n=1 Tax=Absidia glauca TaxID=4829 RepID=A0A168PWM5_ABSGL|nr:hypothetical protein [Absidia glauca]
MPPTLLPPTNTLSTTLVRQDALQDTTTSQVVHSTDNNSPKHLAAISNYKLAQLTFAPPDIHSLRKTATIKNAIQLIYNTTPMECLTEMIRWEFFTLESLDEVNMTQDDLEAILSKYIKIMDSFKSIINPALTNKPDLMQDNIATDSTVQPNQRVSQQHQSTIDQLTYERTASTVLCPTTHSSQYVTSPSPRRHFRSGNRRISWTCDTGLSSFAASQHFAGELQSLFDMEFKVDIALDINPTLAPRLPELSYLIEKQQRRSSVDSFTRLIPAFESFQIDGDDGLSYVSKANKRTSSVFHSDILSSKRTSSSLAPTRSSSLKYRGIQQHQQLSPNVVSASVPPLPTTLAKPTFAPEKQLDHVALHQSDAHHRKPSLAKKKSIKKLAALFGKKRVNSDSSIPHESTSPAGPVTTYNAITTSFPTTHAITDPSFTSHSVVIPSISPTEALKIYSTGGTLLSPLSSITASPSSILARRRRSNSFPETPLSTDTQALDPVVKHQYMVPSERTSTNPPSQQMARFPPIRLSTSVTVEISESNIKKQQPIQLASAYATKINNLDESKPVLYHSKSVSKKPRPYQPYHHGMHQSHSAQELSRFGTVGNSRSVDSALSSLERYPTTSKKQHSSLLKRMTSFTRRKKPTDNVVRNGIPSPVPV